MGLICGNCKYERPSHHKAADKSCPLCNTPYHPEIATVVSDATFPPKITHSQEASIQISDSTPGRKQQPNDLKCPGCKSDNIQKVEMAYMAGTSILDGKVSGGSIGVGTYGVGVGGHSGRLSGTQQTALAKTLAPPPNQFAYILAAICVGGLILSIVIFIVVLFYFDLKPSFSLVFWATLITVIPIVGLMLLYSKSDGAQILMAEFTSASNKWKNSYICFKCGTRFVP